MSAVLGKDVDTVNEALEQWARWSMDTSAASCAGFPKRSVVAAIEELRLSEFTEVPDKPGLCTYCKGGKRVRDLPSHVRKYHPERHFDTAQGRQTRTPVYYSPDDHPVAEAVEAAIVFIGETRPDLYHVIVADRLWVVPKYMNGWDQRQFRNFDHYQYVPQRAWLGESEAEHKGRLAMMMGMGKTRFYSLRSEAHTALGIYLEINRRHNIVPA